MTVDELIEKLVEMCLEYGPFVKVAIGMPNVDNSFERLETYCLSLFGDFKPELIFSGNSKSGLFEQCIVIEIKAVE